MNSRTASAMNPIPKSDMVFIDHNQIDHDKLFWFVKKFKNDLSVCYITHSHIVSGSDMSASGIMSILTESSCFKLSVTKDSVAHRHYTKLLPKTKVGFFNNLNALIKKFIK